MATLDGLMQVLSEATKKPTKLDDQWKDVGVARRGSQIVLPDGMTYDQGIAWLTRRRDEDEKEVAIHEVIDGYPLDAAVALKMALKEKYGFCSLVDTPTFFGPQPPAMVSVEVGHGGVTEQVPWGRMQIPNVAGYIETGITVKDSQPTFCINGKVKQKHKVEVAEIAALTRKTLAKSSIYRGKAIRVKFPDGDAFNPFTDGPKFMDVSGVAVEELIFSDDVQRIVTTSLFTPIERTALCREHQIPLKRGVLLEGPYGTGKTLTARVTARKCQENGWTFIYLETVDDLARAIEFAKQYQPAAIFAEDIDQVLTGERSSDMNDVLNTIDGVDSKTTEIIVVLTTNHVERINQAMLRPGRLDTVVSVKAPDAQAATKLVYLYGRGLLDEADDFFAVGRRLAGQIPSVIREVVERAKLAAITRLSEGETLKLRAEDLMTSAETMLQHLRLLEPKDNDRRSQVELFGHVLGKYLETGVRMAASQMALLPPKKETELNGSSS